MRVQNDVLLALDNNCCVVLLLLDLSAAFDTVDHYMLLQRMPSRFGIKGKALDWFASYLILVIVLNLYIPIAPIPLSII